MQCVFGQVKSTSSGSSTNVQFLLLDLRLFMPENHLNAKSQWYYVTVQTIVVQRKISHSNRHNVNVYCTRMHIVLWPLDILLGEKIHVLRSLQHRFKLVSFGGILISNMKICVVSEYIYTCWFCKKLSQLFELLQLTTGQSVFNTSRSSLKEKDLQSFLVFLQKSFKMSWFCHGGPNHTLCLSMTISTKKCDF